jgi:hypothetical protein
MRNFFNKLMPFIVIGIAIVAFAFGIVLLAYLFLFGAILGFILFSIAWLRRFFSSKKSKAVNSPQKKQGRVIDSDDWKKL